jgi:hypothetical protein
MHIIVFGKEGFKIIDQKQKNVTWGWREETKSVTYYLNDPLPVKKDNLISLWEQFQSIIFSSTIRIFQVMLNSLFLKISLIRVKVELVASIDCEYPK